MARSDLQPLDTWSSSTETPSLLDDLLRPSLRRAFPLPTADHATDQTFCRLLDALGRLSRPDAEPR